MEPEMRTRATLRSAELGFFGVVVYTRVHTPRRWGAATLRLRPLPDFRPGVASFFFGVTRPLRTSCEVVGIAPDAISAGRPGRPCIDARRRRRRRPPAAGRASGPRRRPPAGTRAPVPPR